MINFFRKIRQELLTENKIGKYLFYAVGEVSLVVIGIVIAVQIGDWNNDINRKSLEKILLLQVKEELLGLNSDVESDLNLLQLGQRSDERISNYIQQDLVYEDSMCFDFSSLIIDEYIYPKEAVFGKIKEEGLDIIQNDSIRNFLQALYGSLFPRISKDHAFHPDIRLFFSDYYQDHFRPNDDMSLKSRGEFSTDSLKIAQEFMGFVPLDFEALKKDHKFQMLLTQTRQFRNYKIYRYRITKKVIDKIIPLIDKELDQNK